MLVLTKLYVKIEHSEQMLRLYPFIPHHKHFFTPLTTYPFRLYQTLVLPNEIVVFSFDSRYKHMRQRIPENGK